MTATLRYGLAKAERLRGKAADNLFVGSKGGYAQPFRYVWKARQAESGDKTTAAVLFAVPKKQLKRAVGRNLMKRRSREAYRLNKQTLVTAAEAKGLHVEIALIYNTKELSDYTVVENGIKRILAKIAESL